jgi:hypothetical protein
MGNIAHTARRGSPQRNGAIKMGVHDLSRAILLGLCSTALVACGGDDDDDNNTTTGGNTTAGAEVRVVHAASNAPEVNAGLNGGGQVSGLAYANATNFLDVSEGDYDVSVDGILPDGSTTNVINQSGVTLGADKETSIFAVGKVGGSGNTAIGPLVTKAPDADPASGDVRVQVVHASAEAAATGDLDVYLTSPGANLGNATPVGTFAFKKDIGPATVSAGKKQIRVTPQGTPGTVVFDSGEINLSGGSDLTIAAIDDTGPSASTAPIRLLVAPEGGNSFVLRDQGSNAELRAAHLSNNGPDPVDIEINGSVPGALDDFAFGALSGFLSQANGDYNIDVLDGNGNATGVGVDPLPLTPQSFNTAYALNDGNGSVQLTATMDDLRPVATEVRLRVYHGAQNATAAVQNGKVDVYALPDGQTPANAANAAIESLPFEGQAEAAVMGGQNYDLFVTPEDNPGNTVIGPVNLDGASNGEVYTVIARDNASSGFDAILQNDTP